MGEFLNLREEVARALRGIETGEAAGAFRAIFHFSADAAVFMGHFPGSPLVPAVMQVEMLRLAYERVTGRRAQIERVTRAKFTARILPEQDAVLSARCAAQEGGVRLDGVLTSGDAVAARIGIVVEPA